MRIDAVGIASVALGAFVIGAAIVSSRVGSTEHALGCANGVDAQAGVCTTPGDPSFLGSFQTLEPTAVASEPNTASEER